LKHILLIPLSFLLVLSCAKLEVKNGISKPLVLKDGLLYSDSLSNTLFTGRHKSKMMDQKIEYQVIDGIREGDFIIYYPNDNIQMIGKMSQNKNDGEWKYYASDGSLETLGSYSDDIPDGKWIWYKKNGIVLEEGNFSLGKRDGEWKSYDTTGVLRTLRSYKMDKLIDSTLIE
jgi:antitoxin component YwqK of YwqJK toxin-antitoxin module